jgi:hypothetical protein
MKIIRIYRNIFKKINSKKNIKLNNHVYFSNLLSFSYDYLFQKVNKDILDTVKSFFSKRRNYHYHDVV